jgi:hypothetical protein
MSFFGIVMETRPLNLTARREKVANSLILLVLFLTQTISLFMKLLFGIINNIKNIVGYIQGM